MKFGQILGSRFLQVFFAVLRIRDTVPFWPRDPGLVESQHPDPGWITRKPFFKIVLGLKYLNSLMRIRDPGWRQIGSGMEKSRIRDKHPGSATLLFLSHRNKPPGSGAPAQKVTGQWMPMILLSVNQLLVKRVAKIEILIKLFLENVEIFHNCLKLPVLA